MTNPPSPTPPRDDGGGDADDRPRPRPRPLPNPTLTVIRSPLLSGQSQYLGGEVSGPRSTVYFVPGHADRVLALDPPSTAAAAAAAAAGDGDDGDSLRHVGPRFPGRYKWLRAVRVPPGGVLYGLPCHADSVLRIDPRTEEVTALPLPPDSEVGGGEEGGGGSVGGGAEGEGEGEGEEERILGLPWKYHGGALCPLDGCVYAVPQYATRVLRIDPRNDRVSYVGPRLDGRYKWYGGLVGRDGAIYGVPQNASAVLRIDPTSPGVVSLHGNLGDGGHKWHGGAVTPDGRTILGIPCHSDRVLRIEPPPRPGGRDEPTIALLGDSSRVRTGRHRSDSGYKFLGAVVDGERNRIYFLPSGAERVLRVDAETGDVREVGPNVADSGLERIRQNKWQNGFWSDLDGCGYGVPLNGDRVLRIDPSGGDEPLVTTVGEAVPGLNKWEGCVVGYDGSAYCVPNNYRGVLRIVPAGGGGGGRTRAGGGTETRGGAGGDAAIRSDDGGERDNADASSERIEIAPGAAAAPADGAAAGGGDAKTDKDNGDRGKGVTTSSSNDHGGGGEEEKFPYFTGIPTLRSSAHRVRWSRRKERTRGKDSPRIAEGRGGADGGFVSRLPPSIRGERVLRYDASVYDLGASVIDMLGRADETLIGGWPDGGGPDERGLDDFVVPPNSLGREDFGGRCETAQRYLSDLVANDAAFLSTYDRLVTEVVLPDLKSRLALCGLIPGGDDRPASFHYQRPPTLRLQPGPSRSAVRPHRDYEYGHQDGELNYWAPLVDCSESGCTLWVESDPGAGDYQPLGAAGPGEMSSFHGSYCRHYVPANGTARTRASIDFRVGIGGLFDPDWTMLGTRDDHSRRRVEL